MYEGDDRVRQIEALNQLAEELFQSANSIESHDVTINVVSTWLSLSSDARDHQMPGWFDDHDLAYLTDRIRSYFDHEPMRDRAAGEKRT